MRSRTCSPNSSRLLRDGSVLGRHPTMKIAQSAAMPTDSTSLIGSSLGRRRLVRSVISDPVCPVYLAHDEVTGTHATVTLFPRESGEGDGTLASVRRRIRRVADL